MIKQFKNGVMYLGDAQKILPTLTSNIAHIAITSPPYNLNKARTKCTTTKINKTMVAKYDSWYFDEKPEWVYQGEQANIIHQLIRVCASSVFYNHKIRYAWHNRNTYKNMNRIYHPMHWLYHFPIWCEIIWDRCGTGNPTSRYHNQTENIYQIGKPKKWNNKQGLTNIWRIPPTKNTIHPCSFPEKLVENCMLPTTEEGDTIIDPYIGTGTVAICAIKNNRRFIGIEQNKKYFDLACKKIHETERQLKLF